MSVENLGWDKEFLDALLEQIPGWADRSIDFQVNMLSFLLVQHYDASSAWARTTLSSENPSKTQCLAVALALAESDQSWDLIWHYLESSSDIFVQFIEHLAGRSSWQRDSKYLENLSEAQLAALYERILIQFPPETHGWKIGGLAVGVRQHVGEFRDRVFQRLSSRETAEAAKEIQALSERHPDGTWLRASARDCSVKASAKNWRPYSTDELSKILSQPTTSVNSPMIACETFTFLHLTDLHFGMVDQEHLWPNLREAFFKDLTNMHSKTGPWQAVLFTGDFVQYGHSQEFTEMQEKVLNRLWKHLATLGSGNAVLLAVPGNHDLVRPAPQSSNAVDDLLEPGRFSEIAQQFWQQPNSEYREVVNQAFANYERWWQDCPQKPKTQLNLGALPGDFTWSHMVGSRKIGIAGLNTTFLQLQGGDYQLKLEWHVAQLSQACQGDIPDWVGHHDVCLLLTHQGPDWLSKNAQKQTPEIAPPGRFAVHLFGHMHENHLLQIQVGGNPDSTRMLQGCSLFGLESAGTEVERRHGYSLVRLEFLPNAISLRIWPRRAANQTGIWRFSPDQERMHLEDDGGSQALMVRGSS